MKKFFCLLSITILSITIFSYKSININADTNNANIEIKAPVGLLIEYSTGEVVFEKNADEKMYPASMTKMIGLYLILESLERGEIKFEDIVSVSANAASMGGAQVFLQPGEKISVEDLFKSVAIVSANDAIVALGELVSGSEESFVSDMNSKARELGMSNSNFVNPTGFHDPEHYTTARDMALLGIKLIDRFSDPLLKYTSLYESYIREDSEQPFWLVNTNKLTRFYEGVDGLKTGFIGESRYCLTATAMAPAAYKTIKQHLKDRDIEANYYDLILTGDLSKYGKEVLIQMFKTDNIDMSKNYDDCGLLIYDIDKQPVFAGGSGCACCAITTFGYILDKLRKKELTKVLVVATGALHSVTIVQQKESIVSIAHAVSLEVV